MWHDNDPDLVPIEERIEEEQRALRLYRIMNVVKLIAVIAALCGAAFFAYQRYTATHIFVEGRFYPESGGCIDLRSKDISLESYERYCEQYPGYKILWDIPFADHHVRLEQTEITIRKLSEEDLLAAPYLTNLQVIHAENCKEYDLLAQLADLLPDCEVRYNLTIDNVIIPQDSESLEISGSKLAELEECLPYLSQLNQVSFTEPMPRFEAVLALQKQYPQIAFQTEIALAGRTFNTGSEALDLTGLSLLDEPSLTNKLSMFYQLSSICLVDTEITETQLERISENFPDVVLLKQLTIGNTFMDVAKEEITLYNVTMEQLERLDAVLFYLPALKRVVISNSSLPNEALEEVNLHHENVEVVWTISIRHYRFRTDTTVFAPSKFGIDVQDGDLQLLQYLHKLECVNLQQMSGVYSCAWLSYMPQLKYLVLAGTSISDISPVAELTELVYLDISKTSVADYTPLISCTALEDLNLGWTYGDPEPISQMETLKNLWWGHAAAYKQRPSANAPILLPTTLHHTNFMFEMRTPYDNGWSQLPNSLAVRNLYQSA